MLPDPLPVEPAGSRAAPSPAGPVPPWPGATPPCLPPSVAPHLLCAALSPGGGSGRRASPRSRLPWRGRGRPAAAVSACSPPPTCRARSAARRPQPVRPRRPGDGSAAGPAALTWRPGAPVPGAGGAGRGAPCLAPASLPPLSAPRVRAERRARRGEGTRCPPGGGSAAALPGPAAAGGCAGPGSPLLPQGPGCRQEKRGTADALGVGPARQLL